MSFCKADKNSKLIIRLFNTLDKENNTKVLIFGNEHTVEFGKYKIKTLVLENGLLKEVNMIIIKK